MLYSIQRCSECINTFGIAATHSAQTNKYYQRFNQFGLPIRGFIHLPCISLSIARSTYNAKIKPLEHCIVVNTQHSLFQSYVRTSHETWKSFCYMKTLEINICLGNIKKSLIAIFDSLDISHDVGFTLRWFNAASSIRRINENPVLLWRHVCFRFGLFVHLKSKFGKWSAGDSFYFLCIFNFDCVMQVDLNWISFRVRKKVDETRQKDGKLITATLLFWFFVVYLLTSFLIPHSCSSFTVRSIIDFVFSSAFQKQHNIRRHWIFFLE